MKTSLFVALTFGASNGAATDLTIDRVKTMIYDTILIPFSLADVFQARQHFGRPQVEVLNHPSGEMLHPFRPRSTHYSQLESWQNDTDEVILHVYCDIPQTRRSDNAWSYSQMNENGIPDECKENLKITSVQWSRLLIDGSKFTFRLYETEGNKLFALVNAADISAFTRISNPQMDGGRIAWRVRRLEDIPEESLVRLIPGWARPSMWYFGQGRRRRTMAMFMTWQANDGTRSRIDPCFVLSKWMNCPLAN